MRLPESFLENMKQLLGQDYDAWLKSYDKRPFQGLRINQTKLSPALWEAKGLYTTRRVPWTENGYYCEDEGRPSKDAYYFAGLYYLQEPSAMAPAALLPVEPGDYVLDLCAAPGGKSTELGAKLCGKGLLVSNDISNSRARALLKNLELFGIPNICVTSEAPEKLADTFGAYFDKILVDAPCSGEGMFRKDPDLIKSWQEHGPEYYAPIQKEILMQAVRMLKPGGMLLYSTCTFAKMEDEDVIDWILSRNSDMEIVPVPLWEGAAPGVDGKPVVRLFPHRIDGEGHFAALLHKKVNDGSLPKMSGTSAKNPDTARIRQLEKESDFLDWEQLLKCPLDRSRMMIRDTSVYYLPEGFERSWNLRYLRTGLLLGEWKKKRFEPSQAAAMVLKQEDFSQTFSMSRSDERVIRYLKGETIFAKEDEHPAKGWNLVCVDGYPLGWAKFAGGTWKNKYYPGWRWQ
ncbi:MAG: RsmB/NOP family class I SAM-dependent RNA methyltransferase [Brotaphodocola sp.]